MGRVSEHLDLPLELMTTEQRNPQRRRRVLVLADDADVAQLIPDNLVAEGWEIFTIGASAHALEHVRDVRPDVVLLDIGVPQVDGWEVYRRLKEDQETRAIPVIMVVGRFEKLDKVPGFEAGADAVIILP